MHLTKLGEIICQLERKRNTTLMFLGVLFARVCVWVCGLTEIYCLIKVSIVPPAHMHSSEILQSQRCPRSQFPGQDH